MSENYIVAKYVNHTTKEIGVTVRDINADINSQVVADDEILLLTNNNKQDNRRWIVDFINLDRKQARYEKDMLLHRYTRLDYKIVQFLNQA